MWQIVFAVGLLVAPAVSQMTLSKKTCDANRWHVSVDTTNANILLGGLFDIREPGTGGIGCGLPSKELLQAYEAARWTIRQLNTNNYVNRIRFGMDAYDTCTLEGSALAAVQEFYPQSVGRAGTSSTGNSYCTKSGSVYKLGLIGPMQSSVSKAVAEMAPRIPASVVSMRSSAPSLSNKNLYPTFLRTDQPVSIFARAVSALFKQLQWEKIVIVYGDDDYGIGGYQEVLQAAYDAGICVSGAISVPHVGSIAEYRAKLQNLASYGTTAAVFYGNPTDALTTLQALEGISGVNNIKWLFGQLELETDYSAYRAAQGAIVALATTTEISSFKTYYTNLNINNPPSENPWLQDWYMNKYQCRLTGVNYAPFNSKSLCTNPRLQDFKQSPYVEQTILAIYAYAEAIKRVCSGSSGVCTSLRNMDPLTFHKNYLSKVDVTLPNTFPITELRGRRLAFDVNGDPLVSAFTFYNYNNPGGSFTFQQFATYKDGNLQVTTNPSFPRVGSSNLPVASKCSVSGCTNCLQPTMGVTLAYKPGDFVIAALVNAHESDQRGLTCGSVIPDLLIDAVAARYAAITDTSLASHGVSLGYLIVDVCPGMQAAQSFLTNLLGGYKLYTDAKGVIITTTNIVAVLDMTREDTGWMMAPMLASMGIPQIRVAPTSSMMVQNPKYPLLTSTVPSQETVQLSIVQMLSALQWKYVQIVSEASGSYYRAAENFRRLASHMDICVALWSSFDMDPVTMVSRMRDVQNAPVVVVFGTRMHLRSMLQAVKNVTASPTVLRMLTFVSGSDEFGTSDNVVAGYTAESTGFLSVELADHVSVQMSAWLSGLTLSDIVNDAFLAQWFEWKFSCALTSASRVRYNNVCTTPTSLVSTSVYLSYAPYIIKTVNAVASALKSILDVNCPGTTGICAKFRNLNGVGQQIVNTLNAGGLATTDLSYFNYRNQVFTNVGRFDSSTRRITSLFPSNIFTATGVTANTVNTQCVGHCPQCQYSYGYQKFTYVPGDWLIGATFSISNPGPEGQRPYVCGDVRSTNGFQYSAAVMYALNRINSGMGPVKLNNVTLGGLIMDHCNNEGRAYGQVADIYSGLTELTWRDMMGGKDSFSSDNILAWLTDNTASTKEAAKILQPIGVSIVSPSATSTSLMDNPTFFRTIQGDSTTAMAIIKLCKTLGFTYIQVVYAANNYGRDGLNTMINTARQEGLCVINSFELVDEANASLAVDTVSAGSSKVIVLYMGTALTTAFLKEAAQRSTDQLTIISPESYSSVVANTPNKYNLRNLLSLQLQNPIISDFRNFLNNVNENSKNPFFARYYMKVFQCNLPGYYMYIRDCSNQALTSSSAYVPSNFALSTINAVYAVAGALQTTLVEFCGADFTDKCAAFMQSDTMYNRFVENLKSVQFQDPSNRLFRFFEREGNVVYDILRFDGNQYQTVGTYGSASLTLTDSAQLATHYSSVESRCSSQCSECIFSGLSFSFTPGDIYLAGVFDVHERGQGVFDCGSMNAENGFQLLEAFHFALQQVNSKQGRFANILPGVTLGGVGLDACQSAIRGGYLVSNINNGLTTLVRDGKEISPEEIDVYIGSYSSDSSMYLARLLTDLQVPQISYASTSNSLENKLLYPYFFRTVPADDKQVLGMLSYLDKNNLRYVQLLYTKDAYGEQGSAQFDLLIDQYNFSICVAQRVNFPEGPVVSEESSDDVVTSLLQKPVANTVVIFAGTSHIRAFLQAVGRNPAAVGTFKFVGPMTWGDKYSVTENIPDVANDAVTFVLDFQGGVGNFLESYLTKRNPANAGNNPWFEEWFQYTLNCYTSPSNAGRYPRPCGTNTDLRTNVIEDNGVLHVMNAVYAAAYAVDATLKEKCGVNYVAVCEAYRSSSDRRTDIRDNLEKVNFTDDTNTPFYFVNREGNKGYKLFKLTSSPLDTDMDTDVIYNRDPIGSFSSDDVLTLNMAVVPKYDGSCKRKDACAECPTIRNRGVRYAVGGDPNGAVTLIGVFDVHNQGTELYQCGSINMAGFQKFLTFFWTFSGIAANNNIRLLALDTCSNSLRVGQDLYSLLKDGTLCNSEYFDLDGLGIGNVGAVVVTGKDNTVAASHVLEPLRVTYVSSDSVSPLMDDYQYLLRSITPWSGYVRILTKFLLDSGWTYVNSIYVSDGMGRTKYTVFQEISKENGICLRNGLTLPEDMSDTDIRVTLSQLDGSSGANVVVLFSMPPLTVRILRLAQELGIADDFLWVFAMGESEMRMYFPAGLTFQALVLQPVIPSLDNFDDYVENLVYDSANDNRNRASIPRVWWEDFYQTVHGCKLQNAVYPLDFDRTCSLNLQISDFNQSMMLHYTFLATAFSVRGLGFFYSDRCRAGVSVQQCLTRLTSSRQLVRDDILNVMYTTTQATYQFNKPLRYIEGMYNMYLYNVRGGTLNKEMYRSYRDGTFTAHNRLLDITSACQTPDGCGCKRKSATSQAQTDDEFSPTMPRNFYKYDSTNKQLYDWPIWAIAVAVLTCLGLLVTIIIFLYLLFFYPVKSGTSILGYLTMVGIMGVYAINFAFFLHASNATCGARRFVMGVVYTIVFAPLLVKAIDNWRFADLEYGNRPYRGLTSSLTLFLIALGIILIQCIIPIEWLILVHPTAHRWTTNTMNDYWWCDPPDFYDIGLVCSFIFVMFIILLTAIFAALAWDSESNNRESRWILVAAIATAGCFLVWMIVTTNAGPIYRDPTVAIANFVNATLLLIFIPIRKLHLLCVAKSEKPEIYGAGDFDPYSNVYNNQSYDPEGDDYAYEPTEKPDDGFTAD